MKGLGEISILAHQITLTASDRIEKCAKIQNAYLILILTLNPRYNI
jgi:hypothetical protein